MHFSIWIDAVEFVEVDGGTVHIKLRSGDGHISLRCTRNFAMVGLEAIRRAICETKGGKVINFR